ncbi:MAG TPA: efflux transporter outer membrane subunit [Herbaspirillum sp.]|nr:efflux transporter outer membrane subunit [Herbaspirillum sp.]
MKHDMNHDSNHDSNHAAFSPPFTRAAMVLLAAVLAGCAAHQVKIDPVDPVKMPAGWSKNDADVKPTEPDLNWWQHFGSAELSDLVREGRKNNYEIGAAVSRVRQAQVEAQIAGAPLLPEVDLSASGARDIPFSSGAATTTASGMLLMNYELDFWGKNRAYKESAEAAYRANIYDRETVALTVTSSIVSTYLQVLSLRDRLKIARDNVANAERVLTLVQAQSRAGAASRLDLARQQSALAGQRAGIPDLEQQERAAEITLAILLGKPPQEFSVKQPGLDGIAMPDIAPGLPSALLTRRPDIRRDEQRLAAANANVAAARAALFPSISLTGSTGAQSNALLTLFNGPNLLANLGLSLTAPIFDGGRLANQRELAIAQEQELVQLYRFTVINALSEVEKALGQIESLEQQYKLKSTEVEQARVAFDLSEVRYRIGAEDLMTVLDTQRSLSDADTALGLIKLQRLQATVSLYKALGGGWVDDPAAAPVAPAPGAASKSKGPVAPVAQPAPTVPELPPLPPGGAAVTYPVTP